MGVEKGANLRVTEMTEISQTNKSLEKSAYVFKF